MPFPTLSQLAAKSVAQGIHDESISLVSTLDTKSSNAIVREFLKLNEFNVEKLEVFKNQLSVTEIDFRRWEIDARAVRNLSNFNLVSLDFGELTQLRDNFPGDPWDVGTLDIVSLLIQSTNNYSRNAMIHLGLSAEQEFITGWETEVSEFFPNLQSIDISCKKFDERFQFSNFCAFFPNLLVLDISDPLGLLCLQGIKNLKNLQKLTMHFVEFDDINGYKELSELKNLKYLDVASTSFNWDEKTHPIRGMLAAGVRMEALEFLDCSGISVTEQELETFAKNHSSLKTIAAMCTACNHTTISGVKMLNMSSMSSFSESLEYALLTERDELALQFIREILENLKTSRGHLVNAELRHITSAVLFVLRESFDQNTKFWTLKCYLESRLFEHELSVSLFSADIPDMIELFYNVFNENSSTSRKKETAGHIFRMFEATVNAVRPGILIPDRVLSFVFDKTIDLVRQFPEHQTQGSRIIRRAVEWMSWEQILTINNMPFPTLSQLAAKSVAQGIHDETISLDSVLDTKSSNAIVRELLTLDGNNFEKLKNELSISLFSADIPDMIELFYNVFNKNSLISFKKETAEFVFRMLEATVNAVRPGILIPDRVLSFVFDKTVDLVRQFPEHRSQAIRIILQVEKWMSWEQVLTIGI
ncbi:hypothetical protein L5515_013544 [Caenorhabditis briggsae]|uniref:Uncharacterized protein n=1 Tax=Caenorhabditis briggsae TaxID=6238 RepID=A0AAE9EBM2_CAEBR|nr:hypothetical protein L5515_013544 [Caenorhabditis briggsae]